jgi:hypothetical protein
MISTLVLSAALLTQAPRPPFRDDSSISITIRKRREAAAWKRQRRAARAALERQRAQAWAEYVERVGPIIAAQQRQEFMMEMEARRTGAMGAMGAAALQDAATNRMRYRMQSQQLGVPQAAIPGVGLVPTTELPLPYR